MCLQELTYNLECRYLSAGPALGANNQLTRCKGQKVKYRSDSDRWPVTQDVEIALSSQSEERFLGAYSGQITKYGRHPSIRMLRRLTENY